MAEMTNFLRDIGEISGDSVFIHSTKIEACANKYTFVWKKSVTIVCENILNIPAKWCKNGAEH